MFNDVNHCRRMQYNVTFRTRHIAVANKISCSIVCHI